MSTTSLQRESTRTEGLNDNRKWLGHSTCKTSQTITSGLGTARARLADNREWLRHRTCKTSQTITSGLGAVRARLADSAASPPKKKLQIFVQKLFTEDRYFCTHFSKNRPANGDFDFREVNSPTCPEY